MQVLKNMTACTSTTANNEYFSAPLLIWVKNTCSEHKWIFTKREREREKRWWGKTENRSLIVEVFTAWALIRTNISTHCLVLATVLMSLFLILASIQVTSNSLSKSTTLCVPKKIFFSCVRETDRQTRTDKQNESGQGGGLKRDKKERYQHQHTLFGSCYCLNVPLFHTY